MERRGKSAVPLPGADGGMALFPQPQLLQGYANADLQKAKCGKVDLFQPEVACRARQVDSRTACRLSLPSRREMVVRAGEKMTPYQL